MDFNNWKSATYQNCEDPTEYNEKTKCCDICGIEEHKTYFIKDTNICQDCKKEEEEETQKK